MAFIKSHHGASLHIRSGLDHASQQLLIDAETDYTKRLETDALPLAEEWWAHFSLRDTMQDGLAKDMAVPKLHNTYFAGDYQDSSTHIMILVYAHNTKIVHIYIYIYVSISLSLYIYIIHNIIYAYTLFVSHVYIYIYIYRERERQDIKPKTVKQIGVC